MKEIDIFRYFPQIIKQELTKYINYNNYYLLEEIRIRINKPILLKFNSEIKKIEYIIKSEDILEIMQRITENSLYSYQRQIAEGYITLTGRTQSRAIRKCCSRE